MTGRVQFVVVGDANLDVTVTAPRTVTTGGDAPATIKLGAGGQGANVAVRLARAGALVRLAAAVADDGPGHILRDALNSAGVTLGALPAERTGVIVILLSVAGERSMLSDRTPIDPRAMTDGSLAAALDPADWVHVSGYALRDEHSGQALAGLLGGLPSSTRRSIGGGSFGADGPAVSARLRRVGVDLLVVSRTEAEALTGTTGSAADLAGALSLAAGVTVVTDGAAGSAAAGPGWQAAVPARELGDMRDATGAGDAYVAGLIRDLSAGPWPPSRDQMARAMAVAASLGAEVTGVVGAQAPVASEARG